LPQDPADSLYTAARLLLNRRQYRAAAEAFRRIPQRYPTSGYVADALYYQAQALYQIGGQFELRTALELLQERKERFPDAPVADATFETRVAGALADRGDPNARRAVLGVATGAALRTTAPDPPSDRQGTSDGRRQGCDRDAMAIRLEALSALRRMDADSTAPILRGVLADRDDCSERLRTQAIMLLAESDDPTATDILIDVIRNDPSGDVRRAAVSWLGEVPSERGFTVLEQILRSPAEEELHESAIDAIANTESPRAVPLLRMTIERPGADDDVRRDAISALAEVDPEGSGPYLRALYARLRTNRVRESALTALARLPGDENRRWLMDFARNPAEPVALRESVLRLLARSRSVPLADVVALYSAVSELELKTQIIRSMGGRRESEVVDRLIAMYRATTDPKIHLEIVEVLARRRDPRAQRFLIEILKK
jgi:hypothetical protein